MSNILKIIIMLIRTDLTIGFRHKANWVNAWLFFVIVVSLFPLSVVPDTHLLHMIAPGIIWVSALLSMLLSLHHFLKPDYEDGSILSLILSPYPTSLLILAKIIAYWLMSAFPLILITPLLGLTLYLSGEEILFLMITLLLGTPILSLIGGVAMALIVGLRHQNILLSLLILPLCIPVLIFGTGVVIDLGLGLSNKGVLWLMAAFLVLTLTLAPIAASAALKNVEM